MTQEKPRLKDFNATQLYVQETVVDLAAGEITVLTPVTAGRVRDVERPIRFFSSLTVTMQGMPRLVRFEIPAATLEEALSKWADLAMAAGEKFVAEAEKNMLRGALTGKSSFQVPNANAPARIRMN